MKFVKKNELYINFPRTLFCNLLEHARLALIDIKKLTLVSNK